MKRALRRLGLLSATLLVFAVIVVLVIDMRFQGDRRALVTQWEQELVTNLTSSDDFESINPLISRLGTMLGDAESNWVAIDYRDTHYQQIDNIAIARLRDGRLLVSHEHHCGAFAGYSGEAERFESYRIVLPEYQGMTYQEYLEQEGMKSRLALHEIAIASDVDVQIKKLSELGFTLVE